MSEAIGAVAEKPACCHHCGLVIPEHRLKLGSNFCCAGCEGVFRYIHNLGLSDFYRLRGDSWFGVASRQGEAVSSAYAILDTDSSLTKFTEPLPSGARRVRFSLEGIHCSACVWLIEKLPTILPGVLTARVSVTVGLVDLSYENVSLSEVALTLQRLGYTPHPVPRGGGLPPRGIDREMMMRIGVAAASAMNTMLFAVSIYEGWFTGMEQRFVSFFNSVSLLICLPAVLYSALPLYRTAWFGIRTRTLHIDLPLSVAILLGFALSLVNTVEGRSEVYYDTISMLIFLILTARWLQRRGLDEAVSRADILRALTPLSARRLRNGRIEEVFIDELLQGDVVEVNGGERVPADGTVVLGSTAIDSSVLTGETEPVAVGVGAKVYGGTVNVGPRVRVRLDSTARESRIGKIVDLIEEASLNRPKITDVTDRMSGFFVATVFGLSLIGGGVWWMMVGLDAAADVVLSLLVISCPCALGLAAPLAFAVAMRRGAQSGILLKASDAIERLSAAKHVCFDKTGTVTFGWLTVVSVEISDGVEESDVLKAVAALEARSDHPVGRALWEFAFRRGIRSGPRMGDVTRFPGLGVRGEANNGDVWLLGSERFVREEGKVQNLPPRRAGFSQSYLIHNAKCIAVFSLADRVRPEVATVFQEFRRWGKTLHIISGDREDVVARVADEIGVERYRGELLPEEKVRYVRALAEESTVAMVGDGANDAAALRSASVGIGISGGAELCLDVADVYVMSPHALLALVHGARRTMRTILLNLGLSLAYNIGGASLALIGVVNPLVAAVLMPTSSLTVLLVTLKGVCFRGASSLPPERP